jgi:MFS family permease
VSWGVVYYAFSALLVPMGRDLDASTAALTGAFSIAVVLSGVAGIAVGRHLDRAGPRRLMTLGSIAATALVFGWSYAGGLLAFYLVWCGLGVTMAAILYEPAFVVIAKQFPDAAGRARALTALTLVAALASFIFLPLTQALVDAHGWRVALRALAVILAVVTIPLHALALPDAAASPGARMRDVAGDVRAVLRSPAFRLLVAAFFLASATGIGMTVLAIPYLRDAGHGPGFAAFAAGLIGIAQIPGRILLTAVGPRLAPVLRLPLVFALVAAGLLLLLGLGERAGVVAALVVLGMGNGMTTLARAAVVADRHGSAAYGSLAGVMAAGTTLARAGGPIAAAALAGATGYPTTLWILAALTIAACGLALASERAFAPG